MSIAFLNNFWRSQHFGQQFRAPFVADGANPAQVIQTEIVEMKPERVSSQRIGNCFECFQRSVADADHVYPGMIQESLGNNADRICKVDDCRPRSYAFD